MILEQELPTQIPLGFVQEKARFLDAQQETVSPVAVVLGAASRAVVADFAVVPATWATVVEVFAAAVVAVVVELGRACLGDSLSLVAFFAEVLGQQVPVMSS